MPSIRHLAEGAPTYEPKPGERLLRLETTATVPLLVGIRRGEYLLAEPAGGRTYVLTEEQHVRLQQQLAAQPTYQAWLRDGLLTITDLTTPTPPDPAPESARRRYAEGP